MILMYLVQLIILTFLTCITITFGISNSYIKYLRSYQEYGSSIATLITHPTGWNLQLICAFGKRVQYDNQDHYLTWEFKPCGGRGDSSIPCQLAKKKPGILICGKQVKKCRPKLTIQKPKINDSGIYSCTLHKRDKAEHTMIISTYQVEFVGKIKEPPVLLGEEPTNKSVAVSQQVALECQASSYSFPTSIKWLKRVETNHSNIINQPTNTITYNNHSYHVIQGNLPIYPYFIKEVGPLVNGIYMSKLIIKKAELHHAGFYACLVINTIDIKYREMYLRVLPFTALKGVQRKPPELLEGRLRNVSTIVSQTAMLECRVRSFLPPVVRWVRRIEQISFRTPNLSLPITIEYINNSYQMLTWNDAEGSYCRYYIDETGPEDNDIYISKLVFPVTSVFDTGFYACIVMNDMGIAHSEVFLNVLPTFLSKEEGMARMSKIVIILVPVLLTIMTMITFYKKWRNKVINHQQRQQYSRPRDYMDPCKSDMFEPVIMYTGNKIC